MGLKKIGYHIVKGKCVKVFEKKTKSRSGKIIRKKINYKGKSVRKGTKIYKTKATCLKALKRKMKKGKSARSKRIKTRSRHYKFGQESSCNYYVPYFDTMVPNIGKYRSGANGMYSSSAWKWPTPPGAKAIDMQQGGWMKLKK